MIRILKIYCTHRVLLLEFEFDLEERWMSSLDHHQKWFRRYRLVMRSLKLFWFLLSSKLTQPVLPFHQFCSQFAIGYSCLRRIFLRGWCLFVLAKSHKFLVFQLLEFLFFLKLGLFEFIEVDFIGNLALRLLN